MPDVRLSSLAELIGARIYELTSNSDPWIKSVSSDSRNPVKEGLFVCMPSASRDTHEFLPEMKKAGMAAAIVHNKSALKYAQSLGMPAILIEPSGSRFNFCLGRICREVLGDPTSKMRIIGVTGTNGKTTTAWVIRNALVAMGKRAAYLGTLGFQSDEKMIELSNTTPFPVELWSWLDQAAKAGCTDVVMEVSSHALFERRLAGVNFDVGIFTNLTQDHLDFHGTMEEYAAAKKLFFTEYAAASGRSFNGVLNIADPVGAAWAKELPCRVLTFGSEFAQLQTEAEVVRVDGIQLTAQFDKQKVSGNLRLGGLFNVENASSALAGLIAIGCSLKDSMKALEDVNAVPGRFEAIRNGHGIGVIVDYAHTPDALEQLLKSARGLNPKKIITVFGCGGDRDRSKRPKMAKVVSEHSEVAVITSDNPRTEDPQAILDDVLVGVVPGADSVTIIDRREAINHAINIAQEGDFVVIAGKGHEDYQIIGRTKHPMDDRKMAREALDARKK